MGDRISIQFENGSNVSTALYSHWMGLGLKKRADAFLADLNRYVAENCGGNISFPLDRKDSDSVMFNFIGWIFRNSNKEFFNGDLYLPNNDEGDDSDNGRWIYDLNKQEWKHA